MNPLLRIGLDFGPLILFFIVYGQFGIFWANAVLMVTVIISLILSYILTRKITVMPLVTAFLVLIFGGLTLWLQDATFIKMKPTIAYLLFSIILIVGQIMRRPLIQTLLEQALKLDESGWHFLTQRWIGFFLVMAILNELIWRTQSEEFWVSFKVFGFLPLTLIFTIAQYPLIKKHMIKDNEKF